MPEQSKEYPFVNREISWLYFNERVLQEAADKRVPLIDRLRFLAIFSSNLDEFYRVRVATLNRLVNVNTKAKEWLGFNPKKVLSQIRSIVVKQERRFEYLYETEITRELAREKIFLINEQQLNVARGQFVRDFFQRKVVQDLVPIILDNHHRGSFFPELKDRRIYFLVRLTRKKRERYMLLEIPTKKLSRFLVLPGNKDLKYIILLDDIIRYCLDDLFFLFEHDKIEAYSLQLTRDAELDLDTSINEKFTEVLKKSLQDRAKGKPMRLLYDAELPPEMLSYLTSRLHIGSLALIPGNRYHNFKDFINFPNVGDASLEYEPMPALPIPGLDLNKSIFQQMAQKDFLLSVPYQSFDYIIQFLREAAIDPKVLEINIALYRVAENSKVINALINAARNGKIVHCLIELKARFDEEANISWSTKLQEGGVNVNFGFIDYKIHSKVCLIKRREKRRIVYYSILATGNFNEKTARIYADHSLFTTHKGITTDLKRLFSHLNKPKPTFRSGYKFIITSPLELRQTIYQLIDDEIAFSRQGRESGMVLKMNSLSDPPIIQKLYEASRAGVRIQLIVRGMCCLVPGVLGISDGIELISIVDRFLEHARVYLFLHGGEEKVYLSSADWMTRNVDSRVEVTFPVLDAEIRKDIKEMLNLQLADNTKARWITEKQDNLYKSEGSPGGHRAQYDIYNFLKAKIVEHD